MPRQDAEGAGQAHERHGHLGRTLDVRRQVHLVNGAGRKTQGGVRTYAHHLLGRLGVSANGLALWVEAFQHAHGLKEVKPTPLGKERVCYSRICSPALGGHCLNGSSRCWVVAISWVNELSEVYRPKNLSNTEANRNRPLP